jgi:hypothetical protein
MSAGKGRTGDIVQTGAIGVLIAAGVVIYLYIVLIRWLFTAVAPMTLVISCLVGLAGAVLLYGWTLFQVMAAQKRIKFDECARDISVRGKGGRNFLWIPVAGLLALIYIDLMYIVLAPMPEALALPSLYDFSKDTLWPILNLQLQYLPFKPVMAPFPKPLDHPELMVLIVISLAAKMLSLILFGLIVRGLKTTTEDGKQPARLQYYFYDAFVDYGHVNAWFFKSLAERLHGIKVDGAGNYGFILIFTWPLVLAILAAMVIAGLVGFLAYLFTMALHALSLSITLVCIWYMGLVLYLMERGMTLARKGYAKCPHAGCHSPMSQPVYLCPECYEGHTKLIPGRYGILWRQCKCGKKSLPTLSWFGKSRLDSICPKCTKEMHGELFATNIHVPIYGGPSAGKTMFMTAAVWQLVEGAYERLTAHLIDENQRKDYEHTWKTAFESGRLLQKTVDTLPDAFLLSMKGKFGLPASLYMYDPAGEALEREEELSGHRYLKYFDGLALLIDPMSFSSMQAKYDTSLHPEFAKVSETNPHEILNRVINVLENLAKLSRRRRFRRCIAVVITKADLPTVQQEMGISLTDEMPVGNWHSLGNAESGKIQMWLERNEPAFLQLLTTRFSDVRFFATSALGEAPGAVSKPFEPKGVLMPLCWLLSKRRTLTSPVLAHIGGRLAEMTAVLAVLAVFVAVPAGGLYRFGVPATRNGFQLAAQYLQNTTEGVQKISTKNTLYSQPAQASIPVTTLRGTAMAKLTGAAEFPGPGDAKGSGTVQVAFNPDKNEVCYDLTVANIQMATAAHIHESAAGKEGPVKVALDAPKTGSAKGCMTVDSALVKAIMQNPANYYVNVHNATFPKGAVRGQLSRSSGGQTAPPFVPGNVTMRGSKILIGAGVRLLQSPREDAKRIVILPFGTVINVLERSVLQETVEGVQDYYYKVVSPNGQKGWIHGRFLRTVDGGNLYLTYVEITKNKINKPNVSFGDLVDVTNFLKRVINETTDSTIEKELTLLHLATLRRSLEMIPPEKAQEAPYIGWIRSHQGELYWPEVARSLRAK